MITDIEEDPRHGLQVMRYHTWSTIRKQSVGEHSAQISRIMMTVWPDVPRRLLVHAILHDIGEMAGDLPYPVKKNDPVLKERMCHAETAQHVKMSRIWGLPTPVKLTPFEENFFKLCESLEMWEFGLSERNMGNRYATIIHTRMLLQASQRMGILEHLPFADAQVSRDIRARVEHYVAKRREQEDEIQYVQKENTNG